MRPRLSDSTEMSGRSRHGKWHPESIMLGAAYAHAQGAVLDQGEYRFLGSKAWRTFTAVRLPAAPSARVDCPRAEAPQGGTVAHIDSCIVMLPQSIRVGGGLSACLVRCDGLLIYKIVGMGDMAIPAFFRWLRGGGLFVEVRVCWRLVESGATAECFLS